MSADWVVLYQRLNLSKNHKVEAAKKPTEIKILQKWQRPADNRLKIAENFCR